MLRGIFQGFDYFIEIIRYLLLTYVVISWFVSPFNRFRQFIERIVDPMLRPLRSLLFGIAPRMPIDFSALIMFFVLNLLRVGLWRVYAILASA